ncbi:MAG: acetylornithine deacetylase [Gemmatimonadales bacterium]|nr:acetylornithine deacetylase [Gemmatimonadales bacterium]MDQ3427129.1 acetylornithine deacetylase [Gemmatimonadota bacterium]
MTPLSDAALLARLVAINTTSRLSNLPLADFVSDYLDRPGIRISRNFSPDGTKANLHVAAGPHDGSGAGLTLSGHMDVVPAEEPGWRSDPFVLTEVDDTLVGRGAADMKGFLALAINRLAALDPARLHAPLVLLFTYDEEVGTLGARRFVESWPEPERLPRDVLIGEPTSLQVVRLHKGMLRVRLTFEGQAAHSGYPHLGRNAIEPAGRAIVALAELRRVLEAERPLHGEHFPEVPFAPLNVATVAGGSAINVIPDRCLIQIGVRLLPGMPAASMVERIRTAVAESLPDQSFSLELLSESPAMVLPEEEALHRELCDMVEQRGTRSVAFATDAGWLQTAGLRCVLFGPGSIEVAHRANEFVPRDELRRAGQIVQRLIHRRCGGG